MRVEIPFWGLRGAVAAAASDCRMGSGSTEERCSCREGSPPASAATARARQSTRPALESSRCCQRCCCATKATASVAIRASSQLHCSSSLVQQAGGGGGGISCTKKSLRINFPEESTGPGGQAGHGKDAEDAAVAPQVALSRHTAEKTLWRSTNSTLQHAFQGAAYSLRTCTSNAALGRLHCHCWDI